MTALTNRSVMSESNDRKFLRQAIALSEAAVAQGGRPFGALVTDSEGRGVAQAQAVPSVDPRDWTAHSEVQAAVRSRPALADGQDRSDRRLIAKTIAVSLGIGH